MIRSISSYFQINSKSHRIEDKLLRTSSLLLCLILVPTIIINYIVGLSVYLNVILFIVLVAYALIFLITRNRVATPKIQLLFISVGAIAMIPLWFLNGGILGSISPFLFLLLLMGSFTAGRRQQRSVIIIYFTLIGGLLLLETLFPDILTLYDSVTSKKLDVITGFILASVASATLITTFRTHSLKDKKKLLKAQSRIQSSNLHLEIAKKESEKASKAKSAFLANMSHEIRTPLNSIVGAIDLLKNSQLTQDQKLLLDLMGESSKNLLKLLTDILDISKIEADKISIVNETIAVDELSHQMKSFTEALIKKEAKDIEFRLVVEDDVSASIQSDRIRLTQILTNLLSNAIKYTDEGWVELRISKVTTENSKQSELCFCVTDTGIGIKENRIEFIRKPFNQVKPENDRITSGVGLGLAIIHALLRLLNGRLDISSNYGVGSTFCAIIPYHIPEASAFPIDSGGDEFCPIERKDLKILLVEDNKINQIIITKMLNKLNVSCDIANNGNECLEVIFKTKYDCILMDLNMPGLNGIDTTKRIRESAPDGFTPKIIAITANVLKEDEDLCLRSGMDGFLSKPITLAAMSEKINAIMTRSQS